MVSSDKEANVWLYRSIESWILSNLTETLHSLPKNGATISFPEGLESTSLLVMSSSGAGLSHSSSWRIGLARHGSAQLVTFIIQLEIENRTKSSRNFGFLLLSIILIIGLKMIKLCTLSIVFKSKNTYCLT